MARVVPIYSIGQYCDEKEIKSIKVSSFSEEACTIAEFDESHRHNYYEIIWLKKGKGHHHIDTVDYPYSGSVLFLLSPGQMHRIKPIEKAEGFVVKFLSSLFTDSRDMEEYVLNTSLFDNIQLQPLIRVSSSVHSLLEDVFEKMETECNANEDDKEKILLSYLKILITYITRLKKGFSSEQTLNPDSNLKLFRDYKIVVEKNFRIQHSVQFYSDLLAMQPRALNSVSKKYLNKTAGQVIAERVLLEAKRELYYGTKSIKEIAFELGFDDPAYFTRFFKKNAGISPQEYKSSLLENNRDAKFAG